MKDTSSRAPSESFEEVLRRGLGAARYSALPRRLVKATVDRLEKAVEKYYWDFFEELEPSPSALRKDLNRISQASKRLLNALGVDWKSSSLAQRSSGKLGAPRLDHKRFSAIYYQLAMRSHGGANLRRAMSSVLEISVWAEDASSKANARVRSNRTDRHKGDAAFAHFLLVLLDAWERLGEKVQFSRHPDGPPSGPLIRFVGESLKHIGVKQSNEALRIRLSRLNKSRSRKT
jgi:hypothetical protein